MSEVNGPVSATRFRSRRLSLLEGSTAFASVGTNAVSALVVAVLAARTLGPTGRGEMVLVMQGGYLLAPLIAAGTDRSALTGGRFSETGGSLGARLALISASAWIAFGFAASAVALLSFGATVAVTIAALTLFAVGQASTLSLEGVCLSTGSSTRYSRIIATASVVAMIGAFVLFVMSVTNPLVWVLVFGSPFLAFGLAELEQNRTISFARTQMTSGFGRSSMTLLVGAFGTAIALKADRLLLGGFAGAEAVGQYAAAATLSELAIRPTKILILAATPRLLSPTGLNSRTVGGLVAIVGASALAVSALGPYLVPLFFGKLFTPAGDLALFMGPVALALGIRHITIGCLLASSKTGLIARVDISTALGSLILYLALIPSLEAEGAIIASVIAYLVAPVWIIGKSRKRTS